MEWSREVTEVQIGRAGLRSHFEYRLASFEIWARLFLDGQSPDDVTRAIRAVVEPQDAA